LQHSVKILIALVLAAIMAAGCQDGYGGNAAGEKANDPAAKTADAARSAQPMRNGSDTSDE
jgi:hypothetical protein